MPHAATRRCNRRQSRIKRADDNKAARSIHITKIVSTNFLRQQKSIGKAGKSSPPSLRQQCSVIYLGNKKMTRVYLFIWSSWFTAAACSLIAVAGRYTTGRLVAAA